MWKVIGAVVGLSIAVPVGCSLISTATTVATAPARVVNDTLKTQNILMRYEYFHDASKNFDARVSQVKQYKTFMSAEQDPEEKSRLRTEMAAIQQSCRDLASSYNSNASKVNHSVFQGTSTPTTLDNALCE